MAANVKALNDRGLLQQLLCDYNEHPEQRQDIVAEIERRFRQPLGILVTDSCGFSRRVISQGIIHYLALLERVKRLIIPIIARHDGRFLREDADDFFAVFPDARSAAACAEEICRYVDAVNDSLPSEDEVYLAVGVGYGDCLVVRPDDVYGAEMNLTCKLGEDLARQGEILLTESAYRALGPALPWTFDRVNFTISGLDVAAYRLVRNCLRLVGEPVVGTAAAGRS